MLSNACDVDLDDAQELRLELLDAQAASKQHNHVVPATTPANALPQPTAHSRARRKRGDSAEDKAERFCMCRNTSFDVQGVTGLCASCLAQNGGQDAGKNIPFLLG